MFRFSARINALLLTVSLIAPAATWATPLPKGATATMNICNQSTCPERGGVVIRDIDVDFEIRLANGDLIASGELQDRVVWSTPNNSLVFQPRIRRLELNSRLTGAYYNIEGYRVWGLGWGSVDVSVHEEQPVGANWVRGRTAHRGKVDSSVTIFYDNGFASHRGIPGAGVRLLVGTESAPHSILSDWRIYGDIGVIEIFGVAGDATRQEVFEVRIEGTAALNNPL